MSSELGRRERKKSQTRERISAIATDLFIQRGFDQVTIAQIAQAADVAKMTVFNHFARKEDLFFDREPEIVQVLTSAVHTRPAGESVVAAVRRLVFDLVAADHPTVSVQPRLMPFWRTVLASPALVARAREMQDGIETVLATAITDSDPRRDQHRRGAPTQLYARLTAAMLVGAFRVAYTTAAARVLAGDSGRRVQHAYRQQLAAGFDAVERATTPLAAPLERSRGGHTTTVRPGRPPTAPRPR